MSPPLLYFCFIIAAFAHFKQHFERDGVLEFTQVEADLALHFVQPIYQGVAVDVELASGI